MKASTELCVTEAIRVELNSSLQTAQAENETDPLQRKRHKIKLSAALPVG